MCGVDAVLVGCVRVNLKRLIIVAEIARIDAAEQALALDNEALAVGRGSAAIAPEAAELQAMMVIDKDGVGGLEGGVAQEPTAGVLQGFGGDAIDTLAHRGEAKVGPMGDQGGEQRAMRIDTAWLIAAERLESAGEAGPFIDVLQQVLDAHARQAGANGGAQLPQHPRDRQGVALFELEFAIADGGEAVAGQATFRGPRHLVEFGGDPGQEFLTVGWQIKALIGLLAGLAPVAVIIDQVPEGDVVAALGQVQAAGDHVSFWNLVYDDRNWRQ